MKDRKHGTEGLRPSCAVFFYLAAMTHIRFNATFIANLLERRVLDGKTYAVAPCVAIVEGVLNGEFVGANVIAASVPGWNGRPVPLRHPQVNGVYVSANDPDIYETYVIGVVYNAAFADDRLHVEMWIDEEKCQRMGGDALEVLNRLDAGDPLEVSTGYFCEATPTKGKWNDETFVAVQSHIVPDHIAVLPDQIGACNWNDGCGAPRVNAEDFHHVNCRRSQGEEIVKNKRLIQGPPPTLKAAADAEVTAVAATANEDAESEAAEETQEALEADTGTDEAVAESDEEAGVDAANETETPDEGAAATAEGNGNGATATSATANATDIDEIAKLAKLVNENGGIEQINYLLWSLLDLMWMVDEIGGVEGLEAVLGAMKSNVNARKAEVVAKIRGNAHCAFSEADLNEMTLANLEKLDRSLRQNNYGGKAAPPTPNTLMTLPAPPSWRPKA